MYETEAKTDRTATEMILQIERFRELRTICCGFSGRLAELKDRVTGAHPEAVNETNPNKSPDGYLGNLAAINDQLSGDLDQIGRTLEALEGAL